MWCDTFDMDLQAIMPEITESPEVRQAKTVPLWTYGGTSDFGELSHPAIWNGTGALFFASEPQYERDDGGWVSINGMVTNDALHRLTVWEAVRDMWAHTYAALIDFRPWMARPVDFNGLFYPIMANIRGWMNAADRPLAPLMAQAEDWVLLACRRGTFLALAEQTASD